jgi:RNA polymerase sigma factor (sigma-70 family)
MNPEHGPRRFRTTRWTLVISSAGDSATAKAALAELCETYWPPAYAFVRRSGFSVDEARDLTQEFFTRAVEKGYFGNARPERGRFRSYLLACVRHFLSNARDARQALKRPGSHSHVPLNVEDGERIYQIEPVDDLTPERIYERRWMAAVLEQAMARVKQKYDGSGRGLLFSQLKGALTADEGIAYPKLAAALGTSEGALRVAVHRLRKDFGAALRATVAETVDGPSQVDDELRYLLEMAARPRGDPQL